jgi:hypothetical protein
VTQSQTEQSTNRAGQHSTQTGDISKCTRVATVHVCTRGRKSPRLRGHKKRKGSARGRCALNNMGLSGDTSVQHFNTVKKYPKFSWYGVPGVFRLTLLSIILFSSIILNVKFSWFVLDFIGYFFFFDHYSIVWRSCRLFRLFQAT